MSKQLQKLVVSLEAESSKLHSQLEKSNKKLDRWEKNASKSVNTAKKAFIGLASVASVAIFAKAVQGAIEFADQIGKVSDAVGLATDTYQGYSHAASLAGVEQSQLNSNLTAFVKRVGEAKAGTGPLVSFLQKYDDTLLKNIQTSKNQEHAMNLIANAVKKASSATEQAAITNAAFSRAGVSMVNVLRNGSAGLEEMRKQAYSLGVVLDEQTVRQAEKANDQLDIMARVIKTNLIKQLVKLSPQIIQMGNAFADAIPKVTAFFEKAFDRDSIAALEGDLESFSNSASKIFVKLEEMNNTSLFKQALTRSLFSQAFGETPQELNEKLDAAVAKIGETVNAINAKRAEMATQQAALNLGLSAEDQGARLTAELETMTAHSQAKFALLEESLLAESDRLTIANENRQFIIEDAFQNEIINSEKKDKLLEKLATQHEKKMANIKLRGLTALERFNALSWKAQTKTIAGELIAMTAGVAQSNKTLFRINKIAGIANAVINTYQGVTNALAAYPPPLSFAMAGVQLAAGLAQVSAIKGTSFGGGGGAPSIAGSGGGAPTTVNTIPAVSPDNLDDESSQEPAKVFNISISGNPTSEQTRELIETINEEIGNGAVLRASVLA